ncbi:MAG: O-antigen ligase family protein, partial [Rhodospirillales bacterium]|nr:O-antigen ligase family protein [Rhodospirillales bacterium]
MNQQAPHDYSNTLTTFAAICIGASVPLIFTGRAMIGVALILALIFIFASPKRGQFISSLKTALNHPASWFLQGIMIVWIPNLFVSPTPDKSIETIVRTGFVVLVAGFIYATLHHDRALHNKAIKALIITSFIFALIAVTALIFLPELYHLTHGNGWKPSYVQKSYKPAAAAGALMIPALFWVATSHTGKWKILSYSSCGLFLAAIFMTANKAAFAGLLAAFALFVLLTVFHRHNRTRVILTIAVFLASILAVFYWLYVTRGSMPYPDYDWPAPPWLIDWHRQSIWSFAWDQGSNNRWFGTGINAIDKLEGSKSLSPFLTSTTNIPFHPHNWAVEVVIETGFIGFFSLLAFIGYATLRMIKLYFKTSSTAIMGALCVWA